MRFELSTDDFIQEFVITNDYYDNQELFFIDNNTGELTRSIEHSTWSFQDSDLQEGFIEWIEFIESLNLLDLVEDMDIGDCRFIKNTTLIRLQDGDFIYEDIEYYIVNTEEFDTFQGRFELVEAISEFGVRNAFERHCGEGEGCFWTDYSLINNPHHLRLYQLKNKFKMECGSEDYKSHVQVYKSTMEKLRELDWGSYDETINRLIEYYDVMHMHHN